MSVLHVHRIEHQIRQLFSDQIDLGDVNHLPQADKDTCFLTRGLAAYAIKARSKTRPEVAAKSVTDSYGDNGIDLAYFDLQAKVLYLCQSKWNKSGTKGVDLGEALKFIGGVKDLMNLEFGTFNERVQSRKPELELALYDPDTRIELVVVTSGNQPISPAIRKKLDAFVEEYNDTSDLMSWIYIDQKALHDSLLDRETIDLDLKLLSWGFANDPIPAYYGQIDGEMIAHWVQKHGQSLFTENIRSYKGATDVNDAIRKTLDTDPDLFFYLNNGITALCTKIKKLPASTKQEALLQCTGFNIVNGAQTVGSLAAAYAKNSDAVSTARVMLRLISLEHSPTSFGLAVTVASNTQNRVERRDFVSLDPLQARLAQELLLEGKVYSYKSGSELITTSNYTLIEATVALACAYPDINLTVQAKREIGLLWEDVARAPYSLIFNDRLTSVRLIRSIDVLRCVEETLRAESQPMTGRTKLICVHGNRFILHKVFQALDRKHLDDVNFDWTKFQEAVPGITKFLVRHIGSCFAGELAASYPATFFKNNSKCKDLDVQIEVGPFDETRQMNF